MKKARIAQWGVLACAVAVALIIGATTRATAITEESTETTDSAIQVHETSADGELLAISEERTWTNTYSVTGEGTGASWAWRIKHKTGGATVATVLSVTPPPAGSSAAVVAEAFAASIRAAIPNSKVTVLETDPLPPPSAATMYVQPGTTFVTGFLLGVGPANGNPETCITPTTASCPFNPTVTFLSETDAVGPALSTVGTAALVASLLGLVSFVMWRRLRV
jgi:hypothetical protein